VKARWMQGSLRLRITPSELELLKRRQTVSEALAAAFGWFVSIERPIRTSSASYAKSSDLCRSIWAGFSSTSGQEAITVTSDANCRPTEYKLESPSLNYVCEGLQRSWSRSN